MIEHVPDIITWLGEVSSILKPKGILSLAVPDKRYTFDILRTTSTLTDAIAAYVTQQRKPSPRQVFDHFKWYVEVDALAIWNGANIDHIRPVFSVDQAISNARLAMNEYVDAHCWVFTPTSFRDLLAEFTGVRLCDLEIVSFFDTEPGTAEFFTSLMK